MTLIQYSEGKFWLLENVMKEPKEKDFERFSGSQINGYAITHSLYCGSLQESIAARKEIINQVNEIESMLGLINSTKGTAWMNCATDKVLKEGDTFPLPDSIEFEEAIKSCNPLCGECGEFCEDWSKVIRLKLKEVKEESQDELWEAVIKCSSKEEVKSKFTIKRK